MAEKKMKITGIVKKWADKIRFRIKLRKMDEWWYRTEASGWQLFPPSFYHTHTKEEVERITSETLEHLHKLVDQLGESEEMGLNRKGDPE